MAFKSQLSLHNRWIGCTEMSKCYAWGCPGPRFNTTTELDCWEYKFVILPAENISSEARLRYDDRVVLAQCRCYDNSSIGPCPISSSVCPSHLRCGPTDSHCSVFPHQTCPHSNSLNVSVVMAAGSSCPWQQVFRILRPPGDIDGELKHNTHVMLVDDSSGHSLTCCVENRRKRKRTCQLNIASLSANDTCSGRQLHFQIYKL